jgi:hypothetical protein
MFRQFLAFVVLVGANPGSFAGEAVAQTNVGALILEGQPRSGVAGNVSAIFFEKTREHPKDLTVDTPIRFGFLSSSGEPYNILMLRPEFGWRISGTSQLGNPIPLTKTGAKYGSRFDSVTGFDKNLLDLSGRHLDPRRPYWTFASTNFPPTRSFPAFQDLLRFAAPGRYTVTLEIQCFCYSMRGPSTNIYPVRLPPLTIDVVKPQAP